MNELEKYRNRLFPVMGIDRPRSDAQKQGFNAAIQLDLPIFFYEWISKLSDEYENTYITNKALYEYWINNIYKSE